MDLSKSLYTVHCGRLAFLSFNAVTTWISGRVFLLSSFLLLPLMEKRKPGKTVVVQGPAGPQFTKRLKLPD